MKIRNTLFCLGSLVVKDATAQRDDGGEYNMVRVELGRKGAYTTLDKYEVVQLKNALEEWLAHS